MPHPPPATAVTLTDAALTAHRLGQTELAETGYRDALRLDASYSPALSGLGVLAGQQGQHRVAAHLFTAALVADPAADDGWMNLAATQESLGRLNAAALSAWRGALLRGGEPQTLQRCGMLALNARAWPLLAMACTVALALSPADPNTANMLGIALQELGRVKPSRRFLERTLLIQPDDRPARGNLALTLLQQGDAAGASRLFEDDWRRTGSALARLKSGMPMPPVPADRDEIARHRAAYAEALQQALDDARAGRVTMSDPVTELGWTNFFLAYHDADDRPLQELAAQVYQAACPSLATTSPWLGSRPSEADERVRIGFVSEHLYDHTIGQLSLRLIAQLPAERFHKTIFLTDRPADPIRTALIEAADQAVLLPFNLATARDRIAAARLDVLLHLDVGMGVLSYFLAHARLAPRQYVTWGHPDTTGIPAIDGFISCQAMEPPGADAHYSERLHSLPGLNFHYAPAARSEPLKTRTELGLPVDKRLYLCPQARFKFHPDFDPIVQQLLDADSDGWLVLTAGHNTPLDQRYLARLTRTMPSLASRIRILPNLSRADYVALAGAADVVLDTLHFSGGYSSQEIFSIGTPIVTWPGRFMRGRHTYGFYKTMGIEDALARDHEHYVELCLAIARDPDRRADLSARIAARRHLIYDNPDTVTAMADLLGQPR